MHSNRLVDAASQVISAAKLRLGPDGCAAVLALALLVAAGCDEPKAPAAAPRPNVLLLVMDTTRGDRCSFDGYARPTTPRIDEFAKDAVVFRDAWSPSGWTAPAHAALFTGLRPDHVGLQARDRLYLQTGIPTLAEVLASAGYSTGCFSNNELISPDFGLTRGFAKIEALYQREDRKYPWAFETHDLAAAWAEGEARAGRPFFLFVNDMEPHMPYTPPAEDARRFLRGDPSPAELAAGRAFEFIGAAQYSCRAKELAPREIGLLSDLYDAEIATLDRAVGELLDRLRTDGLLDSTIVIVAGDHGEMLGEHHLLEHGYTLHRAARHVPLVVRAKGRLDRGAAVTKTVRLEDVFPTVLDLCALPIPADLDGKSLCGELGGRISIAIQSSSADAKARMEKAFPGIDATLFSTGIDAVYDGRFHFLAYSDGRRELYDVSKDPDEADDLTSRRPAEVERLWNLLHPPR